MKQRTWMTMLAVLAACGGSNGSADTDDDDGDDAMRSETDAGSDTSSLDAGTSSADAAAATSDGRTNNTADAGLQSDASQACAAESTLQARVACGANAVLDTLSTSERSGVAFALDDYVTRSKWSNFPVQLNPRAGTQMTQLGASSQTAVLDLLKIALNDNGQATSTGILRADDYLATMAGGYGSGLYSIAIFGTPSATGDFEVMFGGHHMAYNLNFVGGSFYPAPQHLGAEPKGTFSIGGASYDPMGGKGDAMFAVYEALDATQKTTAYLSGQTFSDTIAAPSLDYNKGKNRTTATIYPAGSNRKGVKVSDLSTSQQALVTAAIEQWVRQYPSEGVDALMTAYTGAYDDTLFAWAGSASGPSKETERSYLRIDGPRVWIEVAVQGGIVIRGQTHYHTIYRDKTMDYGGQF